MYLPISSILSSLSLDMPNPKPQQFRVKILTSASISGVSDSADDLMLTKSQCKIHEV